MINWVDKVTNEEVPGTSKNTGEWDVPDFSSSYTRSGIQPFLGGIAEGNDADDVLS